MDEPCPHCRENPCGELAVCTGPDTDEVRGMYGDGAAEFPGGTGWQMLRLADALDDCRTGRDDAAREFSLIVARKDKTIAALTAMVEEWKTAHASALRDREAVEAEMDSRLTEMAGHLQGERANSTVNLHNAWRTADERARERDQARAALARVKALHFVTAATVPIGGTNCGGCSHSWPCPTTKALAGQGDAPSAAETRCAHSGAEMPGFPAASCPECAAGGATPTAASRPPLPPPNPLMAATLDGEPAVSLNPPSAGGATAARETGTETPAAETASATCAMTNCFWTASGPWSGRAADAHREETGHSTVLHVGLPRREAPPPSATQDSEQRGGR